MDDDSAKNIRKDSMEVIGDSLKIKNLEDQIEEMLTTRTKVKDTQQRIAVLESILRSLQKEAISDIQKEKAQEQYVKSEKDSDSQEKQKNNSVEKEDNLKPEHDMNDVSKEEKNTGKEDVNPEIGENPEVPEAHESGKRRGK